MPIGQEEIFIPDEAPIDEIIESMGLMKLSQAQVAGAIGNYPSEVKNMIVRRIEDRNQQDVGL
jgi:hypothetical protein